MLKLEDIEVVFSDPGGAPFTALSVPELRVEAGEQLCIRGRSGSGKTTLLNVIAGIIRPRRGRVQFGQRDLAAISEAERDRFRAANVGFVFQTFNLLNNLSALENVALAHTLAGGRSAEARARAADLLQTVGLGDRRRARPERLSVGERQRVALARALVNRPALVLADEPTANLDPRRGREALDLLQQICAQADSALLLVTHDPEVEARFARVVSMEALSR